MGVLSAVISFNSGNQGMLAILNDVNLFTGIYTEMFCLKKDRLKVKELNIKCSKKTKKQRKKIRAIRKGYIDKELEANPEPYNFVFSGPGTGKILVIYIPLIQMCIKFLKCMPIHFSQCHVVLKYVVYLCTKFGYKMINTFPDIVRSVIGPFLVQKSKTGAAIIILLMMILIKQQYKVVLKYKTLKNFIKKWKC